MFRWGYRILGIIAALVAAIMLAVGLIERNLIVVLFGVVLIYKEIKLCKPKFNGSYVSAYAEVEAAVAAVRRGRKRKFSAGVYAGHTEAARAYAGRDLWKTGGYRRLSALLRGRIRRNGGFGHRFCSGRCGFQGVFLAVCPSERPFCAHRGAVRGGGRRIRQERLGSQGSDKKGGVDRMEDTWRENQEYALRQTRICFVVMRLFRWLLALLTIVCVGMGIWWLLRGETRAPAALGMAVCGAAMWMLIGAFMKPYARTAAEIVAALNTGGPPEGGYSPHTAWMVNCYINMHPAFFLLFALLWLILGAACLGGGGYLLASEIGYPSPHIPSLVMGAGLFTLGVAPAVMGLVYIVEGLSGLGKGRRKPDKMIARIGWHI